MYSSLRVSLNWKIKCEQLWMLGKIQAADPNSWFMLVFGACETLREGSTWRFELRWKTSWPPRSCGVSMGWRKGDPWFLHSSRTRQDHVFSRDGSNKMSQVPKQPCARNCWMSREGNGWHYNCPLFLWVSVSSEAWKGGRGEGKALSGCGLPVKQRADCLKRASENRKGN